MSALKNISKFFLLITFVTNVITIPLYKTEEEIISNNKLNNDENLSKESEEEDYYDLKKFEFENYIKNMLDEYYDNVILPQLKFADNRNSKKHHHENEKQPTKYSKYFDDLDNEKSHEKMQGDMPSADINNGFKINIPITNTTNSTTNFNNFMTNSTKLNASLFEQIQRTREKHKQEWILNIQNKILMKTGRKNNTSVPKMIASPLINVFNRSDIVLPIPRTSDSDEKMRSFYPSCDMPRNTDEEAWKDANTMNLFFNIDYNSVNSNTASADQQNQEDIVNIASATLRLYRLPQENNSTFMENCHKTGSNVISDDDKLIRVSVYWYSRSLKKHKAVKRRLADSRMVPLFELRPVNPTSSDSNAGTIAAPHYVEFNVRPATKTWVRGRNLGLGVVVEDMDGTILHAGRYFKGIGCDTVGNVSTPIPIPTAVLDANRGTYQFGHAANDSGSATGPYDTFVPKLDICTIELPQNLSSETDLPADTTKIICKILTDASIQKTLSDAQHKNEETSGRHIRHQHHLNNMNSQRETDFRDMINNKIVVLNNTELHEYNRQLQLRNISDRNR